MLLVSGATWEESANLWVRFNVHALRLPGAQTVVVSYDRLCDEPVREIARLDSEFARHGLGKEGPLGGGVHAQPRGA